MEIQENEFLENIELGATFDIETESVSIHRDPEDGVLVRHVYKTTDDKRRITAFYPMGRNALAERSAQIVAKLLIREMTVNKPKKIEIDDSEHKEWVAQNRYNVSATMKKLCDRLSKPYWEVGRMANRNMAAQTSLDALEGNTKTSMSVRKSIYKLAVSHDCLVAK